MGTKSNHSLRATGAMELYQAGVPEKVIQEHTGHLSLTGLHQYERTSGKQHETMSQILAAKGNVTYQFSVQSNSIVSPVSQPHYSFSNCNVTFNSFSSGYQSPALSDVTYKSIKNHLYKMKRDIGMADYEKLVKQEFHTPSLYLCFFIIGAKQGCC